MQILVSAIALTLLTFATYAAPPELSFGDETAALIAFDEQSGRVARVELAGEVVSATQPAGGFAIMDRAAAKTFADFPVSLSIGDEVAAFEGQSQDLKLTGEMRVIDRRLDISGVVEDLSGTDRAISLRWAIPVQAAGWQWSRSLYRQTEVQGKAPTTNGTDVGIGSGLIDLWPLSAMNNANGTLSLATRIDEPAIFHCAVDPESGLFTIQFDVALTDLAKKLPRKAPFHFAVLAAPTPFGLRSALNEYYAAFPELFVKRTDKLGGWFAWGDVLHLNSPISDFGLMFHEGPTSAGRESSRKLGIPRYPYIEPGMYQLHFGDLDHRPTSDEIMQRLREYAAEADDAENLAKLKDGQRWDRLMCRAILKSGIRDANGDIVIAAVGQYSWVAGSRWAAQFPLLLDPDIKQGAGETYLESIREQTADPDWGEGRYLDSYSAHIRAVDYSPDALAVADFPPCFGKDLRPCQLMAIPMFEYVEGLGKILDGQDRTILVNAYGHPAPFPFHRFDILGKEHWATASGMLFERYRSMAWQKLVTDLPSDAPIDQAFIEEFLVFNIYPGGYGRGDWGQEKMRLDYRRVVPLLRLESRLGWQPVSWATPNKPEIKVERYGLPPGPVLLAVHNPYMSREVVLDVDSRGLGAGDLQCLDLLHARPLDWAATKGGLRLRMGMAARETALVLIGEAGAFAEAYRLMTLDRLDDVRLCLKEWPLRNGNDHPSGEVLGERLDDCTGRLSAGHAQAADVSEALRSAAELVTGPDDALSVRMVELLTRAAESAGSISDPPELLPVADIKPPPSEAVGAQVPWDEPFDRLDTDRWEVSGGEPGIRIEDGKLMMQLPAKGRNLSVQCKEVFDFGARPLEFKYRFQFNHGGHDWYLMQSFNLHPTAAGGADDYLHIRCDPGLQMRVENGETQASGYTKSVTAYQRYETNVPHEVSLKLDGERYRLTIDGQLHGEGKHDLTFSAGYLSLALYSGHLGHGDVCWFDDLQIRETSWEE